MSSKWLKMFLNDPLVALGKVSRLYLEEKWSWRAELVCATGALRNIRLVQEVLDLI